MAWPLSQDYNEAIQSPATSLADPELRTGQPTTNALGMPQPRSGNFADVYEFECPQGRWAVKCFTREVPGLRERYAEISRHLATADLPFAVEFHYLEQGVRIRGAWYPALKMRWVDGQLLNEFVRDNLGKPARLQALFQIWTRMAKRLREANLAHADLQHGNVILVPGSAANSLAVKLIDYDGMFVPALAGRGSAEVGHANYQHPARLREGTYGPEVDRFPLLVVATALRALIAGGRELWDRYDNGDNLLFKESDLRAPNKSPLFAELLRSGDAETRELAKQLAHAVARPLEECPLLGGAESPPAPRAVPRSGPVPPPAEEGFAFAGGQAARPARRETSRSRVPFIAGVAAAGVAFLGLVIGVVWATRPEPAKREPSPPVARATADEGKKAVEEKPAPPKPEREVPKPLPKATPEPKKDPEKPPERPKTEERLFEGHEGPVYAVAFSPDGKRVVSGGADKTVRLWDRASGKTLQTFEGHTADVYGVAFSPDGKRLATCANDKTVRLWDAETGKQIGLFLGHTGLMKSVDFSPDGRRLLSAGDDNTMRLWDVASASQLRRFDPPPGHWVRRASFSPDGRYAVSSSSDGNVRVWSLETGELYRTLAGAGDAYSCGFLPDMRRVASGSFDNNLRVWDVVGGTILHQLDGHQGRILSLALSPDNRHALTAGSDKTVRLWDLKRGREIRQFPYDVPHSLAFSPDAQFGLCGGADGVVRLWPMKLEDAAPISPAKPAEPDAEARRAAEDAVKERYKAEYAAKGVVARQGLMKRLIEDAPGRPDEPAFRFVCLREAREMAGQVGDIPQALRLVEDMNFLFASDELGGRMAVLQAAANAGLIDTPSIAEFALNLIRDAEAADRYELAQTALASARKSTKSAALRATLARLDGPLASLRKDFDAVKASADKLARRPGDPEASLAVGKFRCFRKGDWATGLPLLAAGSDATLAALARKDLLASPGAADRVEVGNGWWEVAEKEPAGATRSAIRRHARAALYLALPQLKGPDVARVAERLTVVREKKVLKPGLVAEYFADEVLQKKVEARLDYQIEFQWGAGSPAPEVPADHFSARWRGWVVPPRKGKYTFYLHADEGARLFVDGRPVPIIDTWTIGGRHAVEVNLADRAYQLRIDFHEGTGNAAVVFGYVEGGKDRLIPAEWLFHDERQEKLLAK